MEISVLTCWAKVQVKPGSFWETGPHQGDIQTLLLKEIISLATVSDGTDS